MDRGEYSEGLPWKIGPTTAYDPHPDSICAHAGALYTKVEKRYDGSTWETKHVDIQLAVIASNEGGYNSTAVCLKCVLEEAKRLGVEV